MAGSCDRWVLRRLHDVLDADVRNAATRRTPRLVGDAVEGIKSDRRRRRSGVRLAAVRPSDCWIVRRAAMVGGYRQMMAPADASIRGSDDARISDVTAPEILDTCGRPTLEVTLVLDHVRRAVAGVPSGASTGTGEAIERCDRDARRLPWSRRVTTPSPLTAPRRPTAQPVAPMSGCHPATSSDVGTQPSRRLSLPRQLDPSFPESLGGSGLIRRVILCGAPYTTLGFDR